jgi:hypothetical protein
MRAPWKILAPGLGVLVFAGVYPLAPATAREAPPALAGLAKARADAARRAYQESVDLYREGRSRDVDRIYLWSQRWLEAEREAAPRKEAERAAYEAHYRRMRQLENLIRDRYKAGVAAPIELPAVEFYRLEAEGWLAGHRRS